MLFARRSLSDSDRYSLNAGSTSDLNLSDGFNSAPMARIVIAYYPRRAGSIRLCRDQEGRGPHAPHQGFMGYPKIRVEPVLNDWRRTRWTALTDALVRGDSSPAGPSGTSKYHVRPGFHRLGEINENSITQQRRTHLQYRRQPRPNGSGLH
jgi:hypothetical protein